MSPGPRYPLHELEEWLGWPTAAELAAVVGTKPATVQAWRSRGLSERQADELACRFNLHPVLLWPGWLEGVSGEHPRRARPTYFGESHLAELVWHGGTPVTTPLRRPQRPRSVAVSSPDGDTAAAEVMGELLDA